MLSEEGIIIIQTMKHCEKMISIQFTCYWDVAVLKNHVSNQCNFASIVQEKTAFQQKL